MEVTWVEVASIVHVQLVHKVSLHAAKSSVFKPLNKAHCLHGF